LSGLNGAWNLMHRYYPDLPSQVMLPSFSISSLHESVPRHPPAPAPLLQNPSEESA